MQVEEYPAEGGTLVACHGGLAQEDPAAAPARLRPFSEAWLSYAFSDGTGMICCRIMRGWFSGRIVPCHGTDPGSIPGSRRHVFHVLSLLRFVGMLFVNGLRWPVVRS